MTATGIQERNLIDRNRDTSVTLYGYNRAARAKFITATGIQERNCVIARMVKYEIL